VRIWAVADHHRRAGRSIEVGVVLGGTAAVSNAVLNSL